jgi:hypothetical protein
MARHYHVDIAAYVADADRKWVDNLLSHFDVPGVDAAKQGVARRISASGVHHIALTRRLVTDLAISIDRATTLAQALLRTDASHVALSEVLSLHIDRDRFRRETDRRLSEAVESIVPARRGRPPAR